jgi:predicted metal-dependent hydrolase
MNTLTVDDLHFEVRRSAQRRALEITVDRGGELILSAPPDVPEAMLLDFVQRKRMWIYKQLARQETFVHEAPRKIFTDGENFLYLGRSHRLRLVDESIAPVKLMSERFVMPKALVHEPNLAQGILPCGYLFLSAQTKKT